jgi:hypothetical protein
MAGKFNLEDYDTVESRIKKFWEAYPDGRILTDVLYDTDQRKVVKAFIYADRLDNRAITTGLAEEIVGASLVTKTSALEVCETSAIGRALANFVFSGNKRPSREEMQKVERYEKNRANPVRTLTPDQTERLEKILEMLFEINEKDRLREIWTEEKDFLDVSIKGTTLKDALNRRVQELE